MSTVVSDRPARAAIAALVALVAALSLPSAAVAGFGFLPGAEGFDVSVIDRGGSPAVTAGAHPYEAEIEIGLNRSGQFADGDLRDLSLTMPPSFFANPAAVGECSQALFHTPRVSPFQESLSGESCPNATQVGVVAVHSSYAGGSVRHFGVFNLTAPHGTIAAIGFSPFGVPIVLVARVREGGASLTFELRNLPQRLSIYGLELTLWGTPYAEPDGESWTFPHDDERGNCLNELDPESPFGQPAKLVGSSYTPGTCSAGGNPNLTPPRSYLTLPTECGVPLRWVATVTSWQAAPPARAEALSTPAGLRECREPLPTARAELSTDSAASPTGLGFQLELNSGGGMFNSKGVARPPIRTAALSLPEGLTVNPSVGSGLGVCRADQLAGETVGSAPGAGCPNPSKIGDVTIEGLVGVPEPVEGSVFLAEPRANPYNALIAVYVVVKSPRRGLMLRSTGVVAPHPRTGRLLITFDDLPQLLYGRFHLRLREGQRAMLVSPPSCGSHPAGIELTPWSEPQRRAHSSTAMTVARGEGGGPCPQGARRFAPRLSAGSFSTVAGAYTPFLLQMTRADADQEITSYSAQFPPGLLARLAGVTTCSDAAIAAARGHSGRDEEARPSCPQSSQIGSTLAGYGVGQTLAYAPGRLYLAGPYNGSQLSVVALNSALVGPFDLGVVVVRAAIRVDPLTAQAAIDAKNSDPIPHILEGIPINLRDIRVRVDRPNFTLNPTSCDPFSTVSTLTGAGADPFSSADDVTATAPDRFQVLDCNVLGFDPKLKLRLKGGTKRGKYPALRAVVTPRPGNANIGTAAVTLPPSIFLAQEHLKTICTRPRFDAGRCPPQSVYGRARAVTPLLDEPLEGPVYLRASENRLPDLVAAIQGRGISIEVVGRIDSHRRGLRASYSVLPDAPVTSFRMNLRGGKRGLLVNAENTCARPQFARVRMSGQNGMTKSFASRLAISCGRKSKSKRTGRKSNGRKAPRKAGRR